MLELFAELRRRMGFLPSILAKFEQVRRHFGWIERRRLYGFLLNLGNGRGYLGEGVVGIVLWFYY